MFGYGRGRGFFGRSAAINLILINVVVFAIACIFDKFLYPNDKFLYPDRVSEFFGLTPKYVVSSPWTIFTAMFLHYGIGHIFANMFTLYFFGDFITHLVGGRNFMLIYFLGGITGNIFYIFLAPPSVTAVGASGAIFALGGTLAVMRPKVRVIVFPIPAPMPLWIAVVGGFLILWLVPGVAWQAHLGGLLFGALAGLFFRKRETRIF